MAPQNFSLINNTEQVLEFFDEVKRLAARGRSVFVDLAGITDLTPDAVFLLYAVVSDKRFRAPFAGSSPANPKLNAIVAQSGFYHYVRSGGPKPATSGRVAERRSKRVESETAKELVRHAVNGILGESRPHPASFRTMVEAMNNTRNHARGKASKQETWWAAVYCEPSKRRASFTFIDNGVGIFRSVKVEFILKMAQGLGLKTNGDIMKELFHRQRASSTGLPYRGRGLPKIGPCQRL